MILAKATVARLLIPVEGFDQGVRSYRDAPDIALLSSALDPPPTTR